MTEREPLTKDLWVCAVCRRPLDSYELFDDDGTVIHFSWHHTISDMVDRDVRHDPDPVRAADTGNEVVGTCDFCGAPHPTWVYPCADFVIGSNGMSGNWAACEKCRHAIDHGNWHNVADRAAGPLPNPFRETALRQIRQLHKAFRQHRTGKALPLT
jgi:hypothetical protein